MIKILLTCFNINLEIEAANQKCSTKYVNLGTIIENVCETVYLK